ncbi:transglutaminase-like domain-containing protein [Desulfofalx alkaliphila]|uniref:transglutaminase-like domain-containing protein n=1 Tax=Desulfofalx alkaliphila TaxID=105483 RepID=UPI00068DCA0D|nr:transglutaminase-like domain-containing protein [Desulfofalx alkaliphila]
MRLGKVILISFILAAILMVTPLLMSSKVSAKGIPLNLELVSKIERIAGEGYLAGIKKIFTYSESTVTAFNDPDLQISSEVFEREFVWDYGGKTWTYRMQVPQHLYRHYAQLQRPPTNDFSVYVKDAGHAPYIAALAEKFTQVAGDEGYTPQETVELVISFVQNIEYADDEETKGRAQYARYPIETLVDQVGDCEDTSILLAAILNEMDYGAVLILLPDDPVGHMAVGIKGENLPGAYYEYRGSRYYYVETTAPGWPIGEIPEEYERHGAIILPVF